MSQAPCPIQGEDIMEKNVLNHFWYTPRWYLIGNRGEVYEDHLCALKNQLARNVLCGIKMKTIY